MTTHGEDTASVFLTSDSHSADSHHYHNHQTIQSLELPIGFITPLIYPGLSFNLSPVCMSQNDKCLQNHILSMFSVDTWDQLFITQQIMFGFAILIELS